MSSVLCKYSGLTPLQAYDNLNRPTITERRNTSSGGALGWRTENKYDTRGRLYQTVRQGTNGSSGNSLTDNSWRDEAGNVIRSKPAGSEAFQLTTFDSLNRVSKQYVSYGTGDVTNDTVMQQTELTYDDASNLILQLTRERFHDATGTGALTTPGGSQPKARVSYVASYPDAVGRAVNSANYGTNGGSALTRPSTCAARSDTVLVATTDYNDRGEAWQVTDPKGTVKRTAFDNAGRVTQTIENYGSGTALNKTTNFTYNADGNLATLTAVNATTGNQVTTYVYGTTLTDSDVASSRLLRAVIYPDSSDSPNPLSGTDHVEYKYNRLGERKEMKDQRQVIHVYEYDKLGRLIHDRVTLPSGSTVDNGVLRTSRTYEFRGMLATITNYDSATGSTVVNESAFTYNEFAQLSQDEQAHSGGTGSAPSVQYAFANGSANHIRPTSLTYPNGRVLTYDYGTSGGQGDKLSRILALVDDNSTHTHLAEYLYVGRDRTAQIDFAQPGVKFTWIMQSGESPTDGGDQYTGWDRFGRAIDLRWIKNSTSAHLERLQHGYDRASNRLYRKNLVAPDSALQDELYTYDGLSQLPVFQRGLLNSGRTALSTLAAEEDFTFDPTGNWDSYVYDVDVIQNRTHNKANELLTIDNSSSYVGEDAAGNMTKVPKPGNWYAAYDLTYDAWNRLVKVMSGSTTVATYAYDGLHRRIKKVIGSDTRHFYYTVKWQIIEERVNTSTSADRQFVWGLRYIDDLVLRDKGSERLYVIQDYFQPTAVMDTSGAVVERYGYEAFGTSRVMTPSYGSRTTSSYDWETRYGAYRWDAETGLCQVRYRYLHTQLGRWVSRDPIGYIGGINLYAYVENGSINDVDQFGLWPNWPGRPNQPSPPRPPSPYQCLIDGTGELPPLDQNAIFSPINQVFQNAPANGVLGTALQTFGNGVLSIIPSGAFGGAYVELGGLEFIGTVNYDYVSGEITGSLMIVMDADLGGGASIAHGVDFTTANGSDWNAESFSEAQIGPVGYYVLPNDHGPYVTTGGRHFGGVFGLTYPGRILPHGLDPIPPNAHIKVNLLKIIDQLWAGRGPLPSFPILQN